MPTAFTIQEAVIRLAIAGAIAAIIGWNREQAKKPAGLRTFVLVGLGSCLFTLLALEMIEMFDDEGGGGGLDPLRVVSGLIGGIGFLGAGTIIQSRGRVEGVTTAAGLWLTAAIGLACGLGQHALAGVAGGLGAFVLLSVFVLERWASPKKRRAGQDSVS
ncbi:MAG: MgtC/SapB family protein [Phycisphaerales bacterium]